MEYTRRPELYDLEYSTKDYAGEAERIARIALERAPAARTLLDVACGTGKHLEHLRTRFDCEGVDLDEGLLEVARQRVPDVPLEQGDMRTLDLGRTFDVVTCLFSAIGFVEGPGDLNAASNALARHVAPGGVLIVEPWLTPDRWIPDHVHVGTSKAPGIALARVTVSGLRGERVSTTDMRYLVGTPEGIEEFSAWHELYLFTEAEMRAAFEGSGLRTEHDPEGLIGRGLWICQPA